MSNLERGEESIHSPETKDNTVAVWTKPACLR